ncbi:putative acetyltransferase [uncultured Gammaproteobacteria bacterium]
MPKFGLPPTLNLRTVIDGPDVDTVRTLFREYGHTINFALCLQGFERELRRLPGAYTAPEGTLLLAVVEGQPAGCVGLRFFSGADDDEDEDSGTVNNGSERACEMKRLYVRPGFRGRGLGRRLAETVLEAARTLGYRRIRLETLESMTAARTLYHQLGFIEPAFPTGTLGKGMPCTATNRTVRVMERLCEERGGEERGEGTE